MHTSGMRRGDVRFEAVSAGRGYIGWVSLTELIDQAYPDWRGLAWESVESRHMLELLNAGDALRLALVGPQGGWSRVTCTHVAVDKQPDEFALHVADTSGIPASFLTLPDLSVAADVRDAAHVDHVALSLRYVLGYTTLSMARVRRLRCGDAVLIAMVAPEVRVGDRRLCGISIEGKTMTMSEQVREVRAESQATSIGGEGFRVDSLPVKLEFVLQRTELTVAEVGRLRPGTVMPLEPGVERKVMIYANGGFLAQGELIQVGEQLAIEIQSIVLADQK
ncbi:FliM/FliN family flagellar motor switch protein [Burkholderia latens]|uniref:FliM/FliN family flagellar motor switch protein n=1 Tax=Burkholderia latens TaxID=488446 RepID=UPI001FC8C8F2|nr:FliM/FliN family flagellar motor switch protein [Burkholderia latens]